MKLCVAALDFAREHELPQFMVYLIKYTNVHGLQ